MDLKQDIGLAVDAVVFGYDKNELKILLIQPHKGPYKDKWALPGGFVKNNESLEEAVVRELKEETNISIDYLEQLYTFGQPQRDVRRRVVSVSYMVLLKPDKFSIKADSDAKDVKWFDVFDLPALAYDHDEILTTGLDRLKMKIKYQPIGLELLNEKFLFSELEQLYQTILQQKLDRRNFRKKILSFGFIQETEEYRPMKTGRPGKLFTFDKSIYHQKAKEGITFEIKFA